MRAVRPYLPLLGFVLAIVHLVVIPVFMLYLLHDMPSIRAGLAELVPPRHRPYVYSRLREMDGRLRSLVRGQGTEFDSLRTYVVGDDVRSIDWRATARRPW